jgi:protein-tyrosine phosphatase
VAPFRQPPTQNFERVANFRDLGGHTTRDGRRVRSGQIFRSGHLAHASDADLAELAELGIRTVFDFRSAGDLEIDGHDRLPEGAAHVSLPMPDPAVGDDLRAKLRESGPEEMEAVFGNGGAEAMMKKSAAGLVRERVEPYAEFVRRLAAPETLPALFHCSAGKDRAGWAGSVVLMTLGVDEEQVIEQYLLSNREIEKILARLETQHDADWGDLLRPLIEVRREYILSSFEAMHAEWGTFDRYLHDGLGLPEPDRAALREALLE